METTQQNLRKPSEAGKPSYLSRVKEELLKLIAEDHVPDPQEAQEVTENIWKFMSKKLAQSYWNGVEAGASGRVHPKADRPASHSPRVEASQGGEAQSFDKRGKPLQS